MTSQGSLEAYLQRKVWQASEQGLSRSLRVLPPGWMDFGSNDYLGLRMHPEVVAAAEEALRVYGVGAGAARLLSGNFPVHEVLERELADYLGTKTVRLFNTGTMAACGVIPALVGEEDVVILDRECHACLFDGARLSGAVLRVFDHLDLGELEERLRQERSHRPQARILVVVESIYSMDGSLSDLPALVDLRDRWGFWLLVDEAHALGIVGPQGRGLAAQFGVEDRIDVRLGTLGKAFGAAGGFVAGSQALGQHLINGARTFLFTTGLAPATAAGAVAALKLLRSKEGERRRQQLEQHALRLIQAGWGQAGVSRAIFPVIGRSIGQVKAWSERLEQACLYVPVIRYPTVSRSAPRLRISLRADHTPEEIGLLLDCLESFSSELVMNASEPFHLKEARGGCPARDRAG